MEIDRKIGIMVVMGVPAIVGGGIVYTLFGGYMPVVIYETILYFTAAGLISR